MSGKRRPGSSGAIHQTQDDPKHKEDQQSHWQSKEAPSIETDRVGFGKVALPHSNENKIDAGAGESAHSSDGGSVSDPQNDGLAELGLGGGPGRTHRKAVEDSGGDGHHHDGGGDVVHPHADEESGGADSEKEEWWVQWLTTEKKGYLNSLYGPHHSHRHMIN